MNELPIVREYENRILDILSSEDITEYFDEHKKELAVRFLSRIKDNLEHITEESE